jgi:hypothetical protein
MGMSTYKLLSTTEDTEVTEERIMRIAHKNKPGNPGYTLVLFYLYLRLFRKISGLPQT